MDWRDTIEDPQIGEMYFDGQYMYMYKMKQNMLIKHLK